MNENWNRWLFISLSKHFTAGKGDLQILHIQGTERNLDDKVERGEFRWTGADSEEYTKGEFRLEFTVNILITRPIDGDNLRMQKLIGRFAKVFRDVILIKKYGNMPGDDSSFLGCLTLKSKVRTKDWGQIVPDVKVTQSTVEGDFTFGISE